MPFEFPCVQLLRELREHYLQPRYIGTLYHGQTNRATKNQDDSVH